MIVRNLSTHTHTLYTLDETRMTVMIGGARHTHLLELGEEEVKKVRERESKG